MKENVLVDCEKKIRIFETKAFLSGSEISSSVSSFSFTVQIGGGRYLFYIFLINRSIYKIVVYCQYGQLGEDERERSDLANIYIIFHK